MEWRGFKKAEEAFSFSLHDRVIFHQEINSKYNYEDERANLYGETFKLEKKSN